MISLDQVQLLEQKVGTAVAKMTELQKENEFLRNKFSELKLQYDEAQKVNIELSAKVSLYEQDQPRIEQGIMKALERLNNVEDSVLRVSENSDTILHQETQGQNQTQQAAFSAFVSSTDQVKVAAVQQSVQAQANQGFFNAVQQIHPLSQQQPKNEAQLDIF